MESMLVILGAIIWWLVGSVALYQSMHKSMDITLADIFMIIIGGSMGFISLFLLLDYNKLIIKKRS